MIEELLDSYTVNNPIKKTTAAHYRWVLIDFTKWLGRAVGPEDWTRENLNRYLQSREGTLSPYTLQGRRISLMVLWRYGHDEGMIPIPSPAGRKIRRVKAPPPENKFVTADEVRRMLDKLEDHNRFIRGGQTPTCVFWGAWIRIAWDSGLRQSDMRKLKYHPLVNSHGVLRLMQVKTDHPVVIRLSESTMAAVERLHRYVPKEQLVFPEYYAVRQMSHRFHELSTALGNRISLTTLRKSSATFVEQQCPGTAWRHLGHKSPETTRRWYINSEESYKDIPRPEQL